MCILLKRNAGLGVVLILRLNHLEASSLPFVPVDWPSYRLGIQLVLGIYYGSSVIAGPKRRTDKREREIGLYIH